MTKFKVGDKVILKKNIDYYEFANFGNDEYCVEKVATAKYLTIKTMDGDYSIGFREVSQWWRTKWFKKLNIQLELNFDD